MYDCVARFDVKARPTPDTYNTATVTMKAGTHFQVSEIVADRLDPNNVNKKWGKIYGGANHGLYTALEYPNNAVPISTYTLIGAPEPPSGEVHLVHTIEVFSDGSISIDGKPY